MKTVTYNCAFCKKPTTKTVRNDYFPKYCGQKCNTQKLSIKTYRMIHG